MGNTVQITFRMDETLKQESTKFFEACGLSLSQGIQLLLKKTLNEGEILIRPNYNMETKMAIDESKEILEHPNRYKSYPTAEEMFKDVLKVAEDAEDYPNHAI